MNHKELKYRIYGLPAVLQVFHHLNFLNHDDENLGASLGAGARGVSILGDTAGGRGMGGEDGGGAGGVERGGAAGGDPAGVFV